MPAYDIIPFVAVLHYESRPLDLIPHGKMLLGSCYETWLRGN